MTFSFSLIAIVLVLSINNENVKFSEIILNLWKILQVIIIFFAVSETVMYSVSVVDSKTFVCLINFQWTSVSAIFIRNSVVDFQSLVFVT